MAQSAKRGNRNAGKKWVDPGPAPWESWTETDRAKRAIKWIELYCVMVKGFRAGKLMVLADFQKDWLRDAFADGNNSAAMELPRGNGKTSFLAAVAMWALFDPMEQSPEVPIVATTVQQASRPSGVYGVAKTMRMEMPVLEERSLLYSAIGAQKITTPRNGGEMFPVSNDPDGLQGLDPYLAVCDEIGFMPIESWDSLLLAGGKRPNSLVVGIGTPGFDKHSALWHLRTRHLSGDTIPGFTFTEYAADENCSITDEAQWEKANPALAAGYMNRNALHTAVALSPESHFRIFRLGQWIDGVESWLGADGRALWRGLEDPWEMEPGGPTWVGIDVALKHDTTAVSWVQRRDDGRYHVKTKIWQPRDDGKLDITDAMQFLRDLSAMFDVRGIAYDERFFEIAAAQLLDEGLPMVEFPQSLERMSPAVGHAFEMIKRSELSHDGDPEFEAQVLNAVARYNERGFTLSKSKSRNKIDATIAMVLALSEAHRLETPTVAAGAFFG